MMYSRPARPKRPFIKTAVGDDGVRPTANQIEHGVIVIPKAFIDAKRPFPWHSFNVILFGINLGLRRIDQDNRVRLPLRGSLKDGEVLQLSVRPGTLVIDKKPSEPATSD